MDPAKPSVSLRIQPQGWQVTVAPGLSLLEAADRAGLRLPRSCRNGTCRACVCRLLAGAVVYRIDWPGLSAEERAANWILPCVALPASPPPGDGAQPDGPQEVVIDCPGAVDVNRLAVGR